MNATYLAAPKRNSHDAKLAAIQKQSRKQFYVTLHAWLTESDAQGISLEPQNLHC